MSVSPTILLGRHRQLYLWNNQPRGPAPWPPVAWKVVGNNCRTTTQATPWKLKWLKIADQDPEFKPLLGPGAIELSTFDFTKNTSTLLTITATRHALNRDSLIEYLLTNGYRAQWISEVVAKKYFPRALSSYLQFTEYNESSRGGWDVTGR